MNKLPPEEYYKSLPKKRMGSGVLFFNSDNHLLVVKPNYKDAWSIPGGVVDGNESPKAAAIRETKKEEIGLEVKDLQLVCVDYTSPKGIKTEALQFIFSGGILDEEQISRIKLQEDELDEFRFVPTGEAASILIPGLKERMPDCLKAVDNRTVIYRES